MKKIEVKDLKNIIDYLELYTKRNPKKIIFGEEDFEITYDDFLSLTKKIATKLLKMNINKRPIAIFMNKNIQCLSVMFSSAMSNNYYTVIDSSTPTSRIDKIFSTLNPRLIITEEDTKEIVKDHYSNIDSINYDELLTEEIDEKLIKSYYDKMIDTDPLYVLFTSGSTGIPKGTVVNHRSVITYIKWFTKEFAINEETIFANQTPFYFSMSVSDIFGTIFAGGSFYITPKVYFSFPIKLVEFMNEKKINTIYWVPSALSIVANLKVFDYAKPQYLEKVMFAGEVMPTKQLNYWIKSLPMVSYANLFGPTEATDICTFYKINRAFRDDEAIPIGKPCDNLDAFIIKDDGTVAKPGEIGELIIRGSFLADGYYGNSEKTSEVFIQNPLQNFYPEKVYKTGDLVKYNEFGELIYLSRKDFQIKHMGYRIELGEIETVLSSMDKLKVGVMIYDDKTDSLIAIYEGKIKEEEIIKYISSKLPYYMVPNKAIRLKQMIYNANGKIDRSYLKNNYQKLEE